MINEGFYCMPTAYSTEDLEQVFDTPLLRRGRTLNFLEAVQVGLDGDTISGTVDDKGEIRHVSMTPTLMGRRVSFAERHCDCGQLRCAHMTATAIAAMNKFAALQKPKPPPEVIIPAYD
ncbi:MAG: hypothetical protein B7Z81_09230, partial [Acidocella sp. 20-61-6]